MFANVLTKIVIICFLIVCSASLFAQGEVKDISQAIYRMDFDNASAAINRLSDSKARYLLSLQLFREKNKPLHKFLNSDATQYKQLLINYSKAKYDNYLAAVLYNFIEKLLFTEYYQLNQNIVRASTNALQAYALYQELSTHTHESKSEITYFDALINTYLSLYTNDMAIPNFFIGRLDRSEQTNSLLNLEAVATSDSFFATEAIKQLAIINLRYLENYEKALLSSTRLVKQYPNNLKFKELYIEASFCMKIYTNEVNREIKRLENSTSPYYLKYGRTYRILYAFQRNGSTGKALKEQLNKTISYIDRNGGGNHLKSLLYAVYYREENKPEYGRVLQDLKQYNYKLTRISEKE